MFLWQFCRNQLRPSGFGLVGVDIPAVLEIAKRVGISVGPEEIRKIRIAETVILKSQERAGDSR